MMLDIGVFGEIVELNVKIWRDQICFNIPSCVTSQTKYTAS